MFGRLCRVRFPKLALAASCVSMRFPTEELWRLLQKGSLISLCQESMAHQLLFELEEIERSLFPCPYIPTIPQRDSLQAASWNALCAPIRQHYLILHTATSKLINNQTYHGLRFWKLIPHSILPILHPLRQNHCLIKMQIASENLHVQSWRRILANLRKWPHKRNETVARVLQTTHDIKPSAEISRIIPWLCSLLPCHVDKRSLLNNAEMVFKWLAVMLHYPCAQKIATIHPSCFHFADDSEGESSGCLN